MEYKIKDIEALTEEQAKEMALETMIIKEHNIYFIDFGGYFKYSALVYKNGRHIYYANDYELHHNGKSRDELRQWYIDTLTNKLFTESEFETIENYDDYQNKAYYLRNYYIMQIDYISAFNIFHNETEEKEFERKIQGMSYNPISFCYIAEENVPFCLNQAKLFGILNKAKRKSEKDFDYMKQAFIKEMYNHEYSINWDADADTIGAFGNIPREVTWNSNYTLNDLFNAVGFTDIQKKAYLEAKREYYKQIGEAV